MDEQTLFSLLVDLHRDGSRQGPGSEADTLRALALTGFAESAELQVADVGCGTGAAALVLADQLPNARITAIDLFQDFLDVLAARAAAAGMADRITTLAESMDALSLPPESLDLLWSEGAIYNIGFANGLDVLKPFLRTGGVLAVSELTWLRPDPPDEIRHFWESEYPEIATAAAKIETMERAGYDLLGYFTLPPSSWLDHYYGPTSERLAAFRERHAGEPEADEVIGMERRETELYERFQDCYSYGFYVARKR